MNIWILNHYAVPQKYYYLARSYNFARQLVQRGHKVTMFAASSVHNSEVNLIEDNKLFREMEEDGIPYVLFRARQYEGSGKARVINHIEGAWRMYRHCPKFIEKYGKPDVIFASAGQSLTLVAGIFLAKKLGIPCVCEVTDLWPESFVAYGMISRGNPLLKVLYAGEKWIYKKADALIFSMEGGRDYIIERGWDKDHGGPVDLNKVHHINNGLDLEQFDSNRISCVYEDPDLEDETSFKAVYCGSVKRVNDVGQLLDIAEYIDKHHSSSRIRILVYGDGEEKEPLRIRAESLGLKNIVFKGRVPKKYIPSILSRSDVCLMHWKATPLVKYGASLNKMFEYFASGKPILVNSVTGYDLITRHGCGISANLTTVEDYAEKLLSFTTMDREAYRLCCENARNTACRYDFVLLTDKLLSIFEKLL